MERVMKNKFFIGVIIFYILLVYVGALMTKGMNQSNINDITTSVKR